MYYQLNDSESNASLGLVRCTNTIEIPDFEEEIETSWNESHYLEKHELDNCDVNDFVQ